MLTTADVPSLRRSITTEFIKALGLSPTRMWTSLLTTMLWPPAQRFAQLASEFDRRVAKGGICEAARWILPRFVHSVEWILEDEIPSQGPLLVLSNHPGGVDGLLIAAALPRDD